MLVSISMGVAILFVTLLWRRKMYDVSVGKTFVILLWFTVTTTVGALLGSFLGGMSFLGLRLYGMLLLDTVMMFAMAWCLRIDIGRLGDFLSVSIIAICAIVKIPCMVDGCCYGKVLLTSAAGNAVRFPSQIVEFSMWALLTIWLCVLERKGQLKNMLWSIATIWFGILRFIVDFMRGNPVEMRLVILGLPAGRFWSLVVASIGIVYLLYSFRKYRGRFPSFKEGLGCIVGLNVE